MDDGDAEGACVPEVWHTNEVKKHLSVDDVKLAEDLRRLLGSDALSAGTATECNRLFGAPVFQAGDEVRRFDQSYNASRPSSIEIATPCIVEVECCQVVVREGSPADGSALGPDIAKFRDMSEELKNLPTEKFADISNNLHLDLQVLQYRATESDKETYEVGPDHILRAGGTVSFRFNMKRDHDLCLLVSEEAKEAVDSKRVTCAFKMIVDKRLDGAEQRLLIPVLQREDGQTRSFDKKSLPSVKLSALIDSKTKGDIDVARFRWEHMANISQFFFNEYDFYNHDVELSTYRLSGFIVRQYMLPGPVAFGIDIHAKELHEGVERSPTYAHGRRKQADVRHFANLRQKLGNLSVSAIIHAHNHGPGTLDWESHDVVGGEGVPRSAVECPPNQHTVLRGFRDDPAFTDDPRQDIRVCCILLFPHDPAFERKFSDVFAQDWYEELNESDEKGAPEDKSQTKVKSEDMNPVEPPPMLGAPGLRLPLPGVLPRTITGGHYEDPEEEYFMNRTPANTVVPSYQPTDACASNSAGLQDLPAVLEQHPMSIVPGGFGASPALDPYAMPFNMMSFAPAYMPPPWAWQMPDANWMQAPLPAPMPGGMGYHYQPAWGAASSGDKYGSDLARELNEWLDRVAMPHLERIPDRRQGRDGRQLKLWRRRGASEVRVLQIDPDPFDKMLQAVDVLALEARFEDRQTHEAKERNPSLGSEVVSKMLAIATSSQKTQIIEGLMGDAKRLLHDDSGCFVVSQLLQEANCGEIEVGLAAVRFMAAAHEAERKEVYGDNLLKSLMHTHANHSLKMWMPLLVSLARSPRSENAIAHLQQILSVVEQNLIKLVTDAQGVRTVIGLIEQSGKIRDIHPCLANGILDKLVGEPKQLDSLITHQFANFAITSAVDFEPCRISHAVLNKFREYAMNKQGTHVLQACISSPACQKHLDAFYEALLENIESVVKEGIHSDAITKKITAALWDRKEFDKNRKLEQELAKWKQPQSHMEPNSRKPVQAWKRK